MAQSAYGDTLKHLRNSLPKKISGWTAAAEDRIFNETSIFGYINGAAEVYKAYNMQQCLSRRYSFTNGPNIILDIFDMGTPEMVIAHRLGMDQHLRMDQLKGKVLLNNGM